MLRVLISVRSLEEVLPATRGGADIIDLKNPNEGSLGAAFPWIIDELRNFDTNMRLSVAIGDMPNLPGTASLSALGAAYSGANIIKVGLLGPKTVEEGIFLLKKVVQAVKDYDQNILVVGAGYADFKTFNGIDSLKIPEICRSAGADVAMLDTFSKDGKKLFDFLDLKKLKLFVDKAHKLNLFAALAGSLESKDIKTINSLGTDIIGFRGAACSGSDRKNGVVEINRVRKIVEISQNLNNNGRILSSTTII